MSSPAVVVKLVIDGKEFVGGVDDAQKRLAGLGKAGAVSAAQTAAAWRTVPAQFTDIVTQLQGGASPFTVLLQQGGQLKDSFGGIGPMFSQLATLINPVTVAVGAVGVALGGVALAYKQGSAEQDELARSLVLTGNAAGTTVGQLVGMAQALDGVAGTQAAASEALGQLAATGQVGAQNLQQFAATALRLERDVGQPVEQTVKTLAELGRAPVEASVKLNQSLNYLTKSVYDQIVALEKQGKTTEAAELAQKTYASAMDTRAADLVQRLGSIERGWLNVKTMAAQAWDAMLNVGRQATPEDELATLQKRLDQIRAAPQTNSRRGAAAAIEARIAALRLQVLAEGELAAAEGAKADRERTAIARAEEARRKKEVRPAGPSAAKRAEAERQALLRRMYAGITGPDIQRENFRRSELGATPAVNAAMATAAAERQKEQARLQADQQRQQDRLLADHARQRLATEQQMAREVRDIGIDLISDARTRGLAIIAADEQVLRERLRLAELSADGQREAEERLDAWRSAQQARLAESLKPQWQRNAEAWRDSNQLMAGSWDNLMNSVQQRGEDAFAQFAATGKLSVKGLVQDALAELARLQFRQWMGQVGGMGSLLNSGLNMLGSLFGMRATGGGVSPNGLYLVGESGPELLRMGGSGGSVVPTQSVGRTLAASVAAAGGAGAAQGLSLSFPTSIQIDARSDQAQVAQAVAAGMVQTEKRMWTALRMRGLVR